MIQEKRKEKELEPFAKRLARPVPVVARSCLYQTPTNDKMAEGRHGPCQQWHGRA